MTEPGPGDPGWRPTRDEWEALKADPDQGQAGIRAPTAFADDPPVCPPFETFEFTGNSFGTLAAGGWCAPPAPFYNQPEEPMTTTNPDDYVKLHHLVDHAARQDRASHRIDAIKKLRRFAKSLLGLEQARVDTERPEGFAGVFPVIGVERGGIRFPASPLEAVPSSFPYGSAEYDAMVDLLSHTAELWRTTQVNHLTVDNLDSIDARVVSVRKALAAHDPY